MTTPLLLFDGECSLCNRSVRFILRFERKPVLSFAALGSEIGEKIARQYFNEKALPDSILLIQDGEVFTKSDAVIRIAILMGGFFRFFSIFRIVPLSWRNAVYDFIAGRRKKWFGTSMYCAIDQTIDHNRFLDIK